MPAPPSAGLGFGLGGLQDSLWKRQIATWQSLLQKQASWQRAQRFFAIVEGLELVGRWVVLDDVVPVLLEVVDALRRLVDETLQRGVLRGSWGPRGDSSPTRDGSLPSLA